MNSIDVTLANGHAPRPAAPARPAPAADANRVLLELAQLLESADDADAFFGRFLERAAALTDATAVAVWSHDNGRAPDVIASHHIEQAGLTPGTREWSSHQLLISDAAQRNAPAWLVPTPPPSDNAAPVGPANRTPFAALLAPVVVDGQVVAILETFHSPRRSREEKQRLAELATQLAGFVAAHLHKTQHRHLVDQRQAWEQVEAFALRIHKSLDPAEVACLAANDGKNLLQCDQLTVGVQRRRVCAIEAVSGAARVDRRAPLVQAARALCQAVADWGQPLHYQGQCDADWPPAVQRALDDYLAQSNAIRLAALPVRTSDADAPRICGVLVAEYFQASASMARLPGRIELLARHTAPALGNALRHDELPLKWLTRPLARLRDGLPSGAKFKLLAAAAVCLVVTTMLALVRVPLRLEASGQLVPQERQIVYAPTGGKILQLLARHGDRVDKGQELLFVEDQETQLKVSKLAVAIAAARQKLSLLDEQLPRTPGLRDQAEIRAERIRTQYELHKALVERDVLLGACRNPQKAPVVAPLGGQVVTFDAREKLLGKDVKLGDPLLRVAATDGPWEVELFLPEREVGAIRAALTGGGDLSVDLLVSSDPHRTYAGKLTLRDFGGETTVQNNKVVLPVRVQITDRALIGQLEQMPVGADVRAKVNCGYSSLGYVWFGELWDFVYERFLF